MNYKLSAFALAVYFACAINPAYAGTTCKDLPGYSELKSALSKVMKGSAQASTQENGGLGFEVWLSLVDSAGTVCAVVPSGDLSQGFDPSQDASVNHRVFSVQKASTANGFSDNKIAINSGNLYVQSYPGGGTYGYHFENPTVNPFANPATWGTP